MRQMDGVPLYGPRNRRAARGASSATMPGRSRSRASTEISFHISAGFTLIELILVMAILAIAVSFTAPALANFFRGRTLDYEVRRLLALTRQGQSRAVSEGIPIELWFDTSKGAYGLEAEPSYETTDPKASSFVLDSQMQIEISTLSSPAFGNPMSSASTTPSAAAQMSNHPSLPKIRFLPDGSISEGSPQMVRVIGRDGMSLWLVLSRNRLNYEIRARNN
jgi:prepilin-type N-terminal cleavage/methylation domain-containing protein